MQPIYVTEASGIQTLRKFLGAATVVTLVACAILIAYEPEWRTIAAFDAVLFVLIYAFVWVILPRRYEVWPDRLRVVFAASKSWDLRYETIAWARGARWYEAYGYFGIRFATNPKTAVVVQRVKPGYFSNWNIVISPADRDEFLRRLGGAMEAHRARV